MFYISCTLRARGLTRESLLSAAAGGAEHLVVCAVRLHRYLGAGALPPLIRQSVSIESALLYHARLRFAYIFHARISDYISARARCGERTPPIRFVHRARMRIDCAATVLRVRVDII